MPHRSEPYPAYRARILELLRHGRTPEEQEFEPTAKTARLERVAGDRPKNRPSKPMV
jgi:hypothetical protein